MMKFLDNAKRYLRQFIEIGFLLLLAILLVGLLLGPGAGSYTASVTDNVAKFVTAVTAPGLIGIAIIITLCYLIAPRWRR